MKATRTPNRKRRPVIAGVALLMAIALFAWWFILRSYQGTPVVIDQYSGSSGGNAEQQEKDAPKGETTPTDRPQTPVSVKEGAKAEVTPIVAGFNRSEDGAELLVDGGVNEIIEKGGICRFTISWRSGEISRQTEGVNAPSSTSCKTARFPINQLPSGVDITIQVTYESVAHRGTSTNGPSITKEHIR